MAELCKCRLKQSSETINVLYFNPILFLHSCQRCASRKLKTYNVFQRRTAHNVSFRDLPYIMYFFEGSRQNSNMFYTFLDFSSILLCCFTKNSNFYGGLINNYEKPWFTKNHIDQSFLSIQSSVCENCLPLYIVT